MSTEQENQIVEYLFDELSSEERRSFQARLDADPELASRAASYAGVLKLVREEDGDLAPSAESTELLMEEARRQSRPWPARLLWSWIPSLAAKPGMALATLAVLVLGVGVFAFFAGRTGADGPASSSQRLESKELASAPAAGPSEVADGKRPPGSDILAARDPRGAVAEADSTGAVAIGGREKTREKKEAALDDEPRDEKLNEENQKIGQAGLKESEKAPTPTTSSLTGAGREEKFSTMDFRSAGAKPMDQVATGQGKTSLASPQAPPSPPSVQKPGRGVSFGLVSKTGEEGAKGAAPRKTKDLSNADKAAEQRGDSGKQDPAPRQEQAETRSAPVLYNLANTSLSKGDIGQACELFSALVRTHRDNPRRADALLGWARCEMARGAFGRAEGILQQLIKEHPSWRKSGETWLAEVQKQRQQAVLRAQRRVQAAQQAQRRHQADQQSKPAKAAPRRATSNSYQ